MQLTYLVMVLFYGVINRNYAAGQRGTGHTRPETDSQTLPEDVVLPRPYLIHPTRLYISYI